MLSSESVTSGEEAQILLMWGTCSSQHEVMLGKSSVEKLAVEENGKELPMKMKEGRVR